MEVVDSRETCDAEVGCDGYDLLVDYPGAQADEALDMVVNALRRDGWADNGPCASETCLGRADLRTHVEAWRDLNGEGSPLLQVAVEQKELDMDRLVYIRFYRCDVLEACG